MSSIGSRNTWFAGLAGFVLVAAAGLLLATTPKHSVAAPTPVRVPAERAALADLSDAFATVAERVKPSVVYITSKRAMASEVATASGSGFIVSADGYILTNDHVVNGASQVRVRLLDRREFDAKVVGADPSTDVAVLKIEASRLTPATLGSSDATRVGQWVLAVGNPFGENLSFTVTQGILSAKGRALDLPNRSTRSIQDFLQTDAAINPGNSGGPLVDTEGQVIGINSAIASETGTYSGYGFAVPMDLAQAVMKQLIAKGRVDRMALGILARDATAEDAAYVGSDRIEGVLVQDVESHSPAQAAGIRAGDLILAIDATSVDRVADLQERVAFKSPGDRVTVQVARKGGQRTMVEVTLKRAADEETPRSRLEAVPSQPRDEDVPELGASFRPVDEALAQDLDLPSEVRGLVVTSRDDSGPVAERLAGPGEGPDVIREFEGEPLRSVSELRRLVHAEKPGAIVTLKVWNVRARAGRIERIRLASR